VKAIARQLEDGITREMSPTKTATSPTPRFVVGFVLSVSAPSFGLLRNSRPNRDILPTGVPPAGVDFRSASPPPARVPPYRCSNAPLVTKRRLSKHRPVASGPVRAMTRPPRVRPSGRYTFQLCRFGHSTGFCHVSQSPLVSPFPSFTINSSIW
jgi:hypothetical protein